MHNKLSVFVILSSESLPIFLAHCEPKLLQDMNIELYITSIRIRITFMQLEIYFFHVNSHVLRQFTNIRLASYIMSEHIEFQYCFKMLRVAKTLKKLCEINAYTCRMIH